MITIHAIILVLHTLDCVSPFLVSPRSHPQHESAQILVGQVCTNSRVRQLSVQIEPLHDTNDRPYTTKKNKNASACTQEATELPASRDAAVRILASDYARRRGRGGAGQNTLRVAIFRPPAKKRRVLAHGRCSVLRASRGLRKQGRAQTRETAPSPHVGIQAYIREASHHALVQDQVMGEGSARCECRGRAGLRSRSSVYRVKSHTISKLPTAQGQACSGQAGPLPRELFRPYHQQRSRPETRRQAPLRAPYQELRGSYSRTCMVTSRSTGCRRDTYQCSAFSHQTGIFWVIQYSTSKRIISEKCRILA